MYISKEQLLARLNNPRNLLDVNGKVKRGEGKEKKTDEEKGAVGALGEIIGQVAAGKMTDTPQGSVSKFSRGLDTDGTVNPVIKEGAGKGEELNAKIEQAALDRVLKALDIVDEKFEGVKTSREAASIARDLMHVGRANNNSSSGGGMGVQVIIQNIPTQRDVSKYEVIDAEVVK